MFYNWFIWSLVGRICEDKNWGSKQSFGSAHSIMRIRIQVRVQLHLQPNPAGKNIDKKFVESRFPLIISQMLWQILINLFVYPYFCSSILVSTSGAGFISGMQIRHWNTVQNERGSDPKHCLYSPLRLPGALIVPTFVYLISNLACCSCWRVRRRCRWPCPPLSP